MPRRGAPAPPDRARVLHRDSTPSSGWSVLLELAPFCVRSLQQGRAWLSPLGYAKAAIRGKSSARGQVPADSLKLTGTPKGPRLTALQGRVCKTVEFAHHIIGDVYMLRDQALACAGQ